jgi:hypothetical protein
MALRRHVVADFDTLATNINADKRDSGMHQIIRNMNLDSEGLAKKRTGFANALGVNQDQFPGEKQGFGFFDGKIGQVILPTLPGEATNKSEENYVPITEGNDNYRVTTESID